MIYFKYHLATFSCHKLYLHIFIFPERSPNNALMSKVHHPHTHIYPPLIYHISTHIYHTSTHKYIPGRKWFKILVSLQFSVHISSPSSFHVHILGIWHWNNCSFFFWKWFIPQDPHLLPVFGGDGKKRRA